MSGICSQHQGHDPDCIRCTAIPMPIHEQYLFSDGRKSGLMDACKVKCRGCDNDWPYYESTGQHAFAGVGGALYSCKSEEIRKIMRKEFQEML